MFFFGLDWQVAIFPDKLYEVCSLRHFEQLHESQGIDVLHTIRPQLRDQDQQHYSCRKVPYHRAIRQINRQILVRFVRTQK